MTQLLPRSASQHVDASALKVQGRLTDADRSEILSLFGRVKGVNQKPLVLAIAWDDFSFAARIKTRKEEVFFVRVEGNWVVSAVTRVVP